MAPLIIANTGPRFDYADVWRFPCCEATVVGEIRDGSDIQPPQSPGCTLGEHLLRIIDVPTPAEHEGPGQGYSEIANKGEQTAPSAYRGDDPDLFVSYSHKDSQCVFPEIHFLQTKRIRAWYDEGIDPGTIWMDSLAAAIDNSRLLLFYVSPRSVSSKHCRNEINYALNANKRVLPVHLAPTELPKCLQLSLASIQAIMRYRLDIARYSKTLILAIQRIIAEPAAAADRGRDLGSSRLDGSPRGPGG